MADKKGGKGDAKKESYSRIKHYRVEGSKVVRERQECPKCGPGYFLGMHKDRTSCGHCGYTQMKKAAA